MADSTGADMGFTKQQQEAARKANEKLIADLAKAAEKMRQEQANKK